MISCDVIFIDFLENCIFYHIPVGAAVHIVSKTDAPAGFSQSESGHRVLGICRELNTLLLHTRAIGGRIPCCLLLCFANLKKELLLH